MAGLIKKLPPTVIKKIAAGEVVERPASVVKELVENAIDAGSTSITVKIEEGGKKLIEVHDNGIGMTEEDALVAVERHTTSKIRSVEDLERISTLGFRGEALYAISSVSMFTLITRSSEDDIGTRIVIHGGVVKEISKIFREKGTSVYVRNLFFNLRARRKFLKSKRTEEHHIRRILTQYALSYPYINFEYLEDGVTFLSLEAASLEERMASLLEGDIIHKDSCSEGKIKSDLYIVKASKAKGEIFLFVNGRAVYERYLFSTIKKALRQRFLSWELPAVVLFLEMDPSDVDVNVHPSKREVKFRDNDKILSLVIESFKPVSKPFSVSAGSTSIINSKTYLKSSLPYELEDALRFIGEYSDVYLLYEDKEGDLVVVDKHAFHERIIFDRIIDGSSKKHPVFVPMEDLEVLLPFKAFLERMGFVIDFEKNAVLFAPEWAYGKEERILAGIISMIRNSELADVSYEEYARKACRIAVKEGDYTSKTDATFVKRFLLEKGFGISCPHGRPVVVKLKRENLDSLFKRRR